MPKAVVNSKIDYANVFGRVNIHDIWLNQSVTNFSSPTFANIHLTGDVFAEGNLYVEGNTSIFNTNVFESEDNILLINSRETGSGVTLNQAGLEIERGSLENYRIVWNETNGRLQAGPISNLNSIALLSGNLLDGGVMIYDSSNGLIESRDHIDIPIRFTNTTTSTSNTVGAVIFSGDTSFLGSARFNSNKISATSASNLVLESSNLFLNPTSSVQIPYNIPVNFGANNTGITNDTNGTFTIFASNQIALNSQSVNIPNNIPIYLGSTSSSITGSSGSIALNVSGNVTVPVTKPIIIGDTFQRLIGSAGGDVTLGSSNDIILSPFSVVRVASGIKMQFGDLAFVRADSSNNMFLDAPGDIRVSAANFSVPNVRIGNNFITASGANLLVTTNKIYTDVFQGTQFNIGDNYTLTNTGGSASFASNNIEVFKITTGSLIISSTKNSSSPTDASIIVSAGIGIVGDLVSSGRISTSVDSVNAVSIKNSSGTEHLSVNTSTGTISISGVFNANSVFSVNNSVNVTGTENTSDASSGALIVSGSAAFKKTVNIAGITNAFGGINLQGSLVTNSGVPLVSTDLATKGYVDLIRQGLFVKDSVRVATVTSGTLSSSFTPGSSIDTYTLVLGDRILIKDQIDPIENGIYTVTANIPTRTLDNNNGSFASGTFVFVQNGSVNKSLGWICNSPSGTDTVGTDPLNYTQFTGLGEVDAGLGLSKTFNTLDINVASGTGGIEISGDALRISSSVIGTGLTGGSGNIISVLSDLSHVTTLGTIGTGVWEASTINVNRGGTGNTFFSSGSFLLGNGTNPVSGTTQLNFNGGILNVTGGILVSESVAFTNTTTSIRASAGKLVLSGITNFTDLTTSTNSSTASIVLSGGLSIDNAEPASSVFNGGALTVAGGAAILGDLFIGGQLNSSAGGGTFAFLTITSTEESLGLTSGSLLTFGGITIQSSTDAASGTSGGAMTIAGGLAVAKKIQSNSGFYTGTTSLTQTGINFQNNVSIGALIVTNNDISLGTVTLSSSTGSLNINRSLQLNGSASSLVISNPDTSHASFITSTSTSANLSFGINTTFTNNTLFQAPVIASNWTFFPSITNSSPTDLLWVYLGPVLQNTEFEFIGTKISLDNSGNVSYSTYGTDHVRVVVYNDTIDNLLFVRVPANLTTSVKGFNVTSVPVTQGTGVTPSSYNIAWTNVNLTKLSYDLGDLTATNLGVSNNFLNVAVNSTVSRDTGLVSGRYQIDNDIGAGDIVNDIDYFTDSIPNQSTATTSQIVLSSSASPVNDYYNGMWLRIVTGTALNQIRQITSYNGSLRVASLSSPFTGLQPSIGDTVYIYSKSYTANYYSESTDSFVLGYTNNPSGTIANMGYSNLTLGGIYATRATVIDGTVTITNSTMSTNSSTGALVVNGGLSTQDSLTVKKNIFVGSGNVALAADLHIQRNTRANILIDAGIQADLELKNSSASYTVSANGNLFSINASGSAGVLTLNTSGYLGVNTSNSSSLITLAENNYISTNTTTGYLGLSSVNNNSTLGSSIILNSNTVNSGELKLQSASIGMYGLDGNRMLNAANNSVSVTSTSPTRNTTTSGALIVSGGVLIKTTENAAGYTSGGALAVLGGACINKDLYLGGNLYITGSLNAGGSTTTPTITFDTGNFINATLNDCTNTRLITISNAGILTFAVSVYPTVAFEDTHIILTLPGRTNGFLERLEVMTVVSGYTDETELIVLQNIIGVGIIGTNQVLIKFQAPSTGLCRLQVQCNYTLV